MKIKLETQDDICEAVNVKFTPNEYLVMVSAIKKIAKSEIEPIHDKDKAVLNRMIAEIDDFHKRNREVKDDAT